MEASLQGARYFSDTTLGQASFAFSLGMGPSPYAQDCFPVRTLRRNPILGEGRWLDDWRRQAKEQTNQLRRPEPRSLSVLRADRNLTQTEERTVEDQVADFSQPPVLDGFFLLKLCCVDDPADLCIVDISHKGLHEANKEDLVLFVNVAIINAGENLLPLGIFAGFPNLRELEAPLNEIREIRLENDSFPFLETLDLSFNRVDADHIRNLGEIETLKRLKLGFNGLLAIPVETTRPVALESDDDIMTRTKERFPNLEELDLDGNRLDDGVFEVLGRIKKLRKLNLSQNEITSVPHLRVSRGSCVRMTPETAEKKLSEDASPEESSRHSSASGIQALQGKSSRTRSSKSRVRSSGHQSPTQDEPAHPETATMEPEAPPPTVAEPASVKDATELSEAVADDLLNNSSVAAVIVVTDVDRVDEKTELDEDISHNLNELEISEDENGFHNDEFALPDTRPATPFDISDPTAIRDPFPTLEVLNLAHNQIRDENDVAPVIAWPSLRQLHLINNPLVAVRHGVPSILRNVLEEHKNKEFRRRERADLSPPRTLANTPLQRRKVKSILPVVPRKNKQLILQAPPDMLRTYMELARMNYTLTPKSRKPLPEIGDRLVEGCPDSRGMELLEINNRSRVYEKELLSRGTPDGREGSAAESVVTFASSEIVGEASPKDADKYEKSAGDSGGFFLTQDEEAEETSSNVKTEEKIKKLPRERILQGKSAAKTDDNPYHKKSARKKLRGFELFFDDDDSSEEATSFDVRADYFKLRKAISRHQSLSLNRTHGRRREDNQNQNPQDRAKEKPIEIQGETRKSRRKVDTMKKTLSDMRRNVRLQEGRLDDVLAENATQPVRLRTFREAETLLRRVQAQYNNVRIESLQDTLEAKDVIMAALGKMETNLKESNGSYL